MDTVTSDAIATIRSLVDLRSKLNEKNTIIDNVQFFSMFLEL